MLIKFIIVVIFLINLKPPFVSLLDTSLICFLIFLLISSKSIFSLKEIIILKYKVIIILILTTIINLLSPNYKIEEAHSVFINNNDLNIIKRFLPSNIFLDIKDNFQKFDVNRMIKSDDIFTVTSYENLKKINSPYAFSSDSFFQNNKFSRQINKINFSSREDLRIGHLNTLKYNLVHDKKFRRILPYYVLYEIPNIAKNSSICVNGKAYYHYTQEKLEINQIKNLDFLKVDNEKCLEIKSNFENLYIVGFSINEKDELSIQLKKNTFLKFLDIIKYTIIITTIIASFFLLQLKFHINSLIYFVSVLSTFILALIRDSNLISGFRYFRGGADGLLHNSYAQSIVQNLSEGNYLLALRGGEDVFYNMPGLRYFGAFSKIFFGDTNYAYLIISTLLPFFIFIFFKKYLSNRYALILFISFVFVPIFENMGFGYFNYIWQVARNHAETLSITLIIISLVLIIDINDYRKKINNEKFTLILVGLCLSFASISRPNFFPTALCISSYIFLIFILRKNYLSSFLILISFSTVLLCLFHNIYFSQSFFMFTNSHMYNFPLNFNEYIEGIKNFFLLNFQNNNLMIIFKQFSLWNPLYNIHRLLILLIIIYYITTRKQSLFTYFLFMSAFSQHGVLLITKPSSRYAYLAWLLTFILFIKIEFDNRLTKSLYLNFKNKFKLKLL